MGLRTKEVCLSIHQKGLDTDSFPPAVMLATIASLRPRTVALSCGDEQCSYAQLEAHSADLAGALKAQGIGRGDLVAVFAPRSVAQITALYAVWRVGAAYLPLDPEWPDARVQRLLAASGAKLAIAPRALAGRIPAAVPVLDPAATSEKPWHGCSVAPEDLAYVIYTSGSTGEPKGVEVSHANLAALVEWHIERFELTAESRTSHTAGLAFDASAWEVWPTLACGGTLVVPDDETLRYEPARLQRWLIDEKVEVSFAPTAIAEPLIAMDWPEGTALRVLLTGADRLKLRPRAGLPFAFFNNYGPTECTVVATSGIVTAEGDGLPSIGMPIAGTQIHIFDTAGGPCAPGEEGEIWIGGAQVARGYRGDAALTAARFVEHGQFGRLYRTGDLAAWQDNGDIAYRGRVDTQIKVRGHRIEPAEIEAAIIAAPGVAAAAVAMHGGELTAWIVPQDGAELRAGDLRAALAADLPGPMLPSRFALLAALPLTANGKLDSKALPDPATCAIPEVASLAAPSTPTEERLLAIIAEVIGRSDIGVDDDFFLLGGHSLLGTQVIMRARDAFGVSLTLFHLFEGRTVAATAATIEGLIMDKLAAMSDEDIQRMMER